MDFKPKQYYKQAQAKPKKYSKTFNAYFRTEDGSLCMIRDAECASHNDAILSAKEMLVAEGDCLTNKAILVSITGGKQ